jgi:predicted DNA-binding ribbon-helix-helix protein
MSNKNKTIVVPVRTHSTKKGVLDKIAQSRGISYNKLINELMDNCIKNSILDEHF